MAMILGEKQQQATINVTPMIDVLLVLLIIFMAVAPEKQQGLDARIPLQPDQSVPNEAENPVVLSIERDGAYRLNTQPVAQSDLGDRLTEVFGRRAQRVLFLAADGGLEFNAVAAAIDVARGANISVGLLPR